MSKKKIISAVAILILLATIFFVFVCFSGNRWSKYKADSSSYEKIKSERTVSDAKLIESIQFNGFDLFFDKINNRWFYSLVEGDKKQNNPIVSVNVNDKNVKFVTMGDILDKDAKILAYTDDVYVEYELVSTTLPVMNIACDKMPIKDDNGEMKDVSCDMRLFDNRKSVNNRIMDSAGEIRVRGSSTTVHPKLGYKLQLRRKEGDKVKNNDLSLLGMRSDDDWVLYAAYNDYEKVRSVFSANLWYDSCADDNIFGVKNGMQYKFIELFFNDEYYGLYALGYPIDEKQLGLKATSDSASSEYSYKKTAWVSEKEINLNVRDDNKGYSLLTKFENPDDYSAWWPLRHYYQTVFTVTEGQGALLYNLIDYNNAIDMYLYILMIQGEDHIHDYALRNMYITAKSTENSHVMMYTPWDMDITWGLKWDSNGWDYNRTISYGYSPNDSDMFVMKSSAVNALLEINDPLIRQFIVARYSELRKNAWSEENIDKMIDGYEKDIFDSGAFERDKERWPYGNYCKESDKLNVFKKYVHDRLKAMDEYVGGI